MLWLLICSSNFNLYSDSRAIIIVLRLVFRLVFGFRIKPLPIINYCPLTIFLLRILLDDEMHLAKTAQDYSFSFKILLFLFSSQQHLEIGSKDNQICIVKWFFFCIRQ